MYRHGSWAAHPASSDTTKHQMVAWTASVYTSCSVACHIANHPFHISALVPGLSCRLGAGGPARDDTPGGVDGRGQAHALLPRLLHSDSRRSRAPRRLLRPSGAAVRGGDRGRHFGCPVGPGVVAPARRGVRRGAAAARRHAGTRASATGCGRPAACMDMSRAEHWERMCVDCKQSRALRVCVLLDCQQSKRACALCMGHRSWHRNA